MDFVRFQLSSHFFLTIISQFCCQTESALIYFDQLFDCLQAEELYGPRVSPPSLRGVFFSFFSTSPDKSASLSPSVPFFLQGFLFWVNSP